MSQAGEWDVAANRVIGEVIPVDATASDAARLGRDLAASSDRVAMVVMGDGASTLSVKAPGYLVPGAREWQDDATRALATADVAAIAALNADDAVRFGAAGRAAWQVLAGAAGATRASEGTCHGRLTCWLTSRPTGSPTWWRRGFAPHDCTPDRCRGAHRGRQVRPRHRAGVAARRRSSERRLDAALPRYGHRYRQALARRASRRAAPPARHLAGHSHRDAWRSTKRSRSMPSTTSPSAARCLSSSAAQACTCIR